MGMETFTIYGKLGFEHVLDPAGYDHVLFLIALAIPFTYRQWRPVVWLATLFTIAHCLSLALAAFGWVEVDSAWVEFLIPVTILLTAGFNLWILRQDWDSSRALKWHLMATSIFGLIHGFGFSNYFSMLMSGEEEKTSPLLGFALGIEGAQLVVLAVVLLLSYFLLDKLRLPRKPYIALVSLAILVLSGVLAVNAFPL
ncbi:HupE / UreJ protein [Robiginitalea myxolifaciens]|uniref:HupE / UreJ protein n=2 Tax=Robiginitalea myxolifaciens TaxID=400055 RepID=A0A1I6FZR7_9FLAO|nr:HupE / UreJ protein [Robiginitalea myxolifaciens]